MKGASFVRHLISITFVSFWYYYTSKYRWYTNSHKSKREKNCYLLLIMSNLETFMHGELLGVGARIFCWASPTGVKNLPRFLVTFVDMLRNYVTFFKSKSVIRMSIFSSLNRVQIWYQNNNKHSPLTLSAILKICNSYPQMGEHCLLSVRSYWLNTESCHGIVLYSYLKAREEI